MYCYDGDHCSAEWPIFSQSFGSAYFGVQKNTRLTQWLQGAQWSALQHSAHSCFEIFVFIYCARFSPNSCCTSWPDISTWTVFQMFCGLFVVAVMFFSERRSNLFSLFLNLLWWILTSNIQTEAYRVRDAGLGSFGSLSEHCTVWPWG